MPDDRLAVALTKLNDMQHPSIVKLLRGAGYEYEADVVEEVLAAACAAKLVVPKIDLVKNANAGDKKLALGLTEADLIGES